MGYGPQERETVPVHRQGEGDLLEIGTGILGVAVGRLDGPTAQRRQGRREEVAQGILLFGNLHIIVHIENACGGVEVHEGEVHLLFEPKTESHLPENAGGTDLVEGIEASSQPIVVEMIRADALSKEQLGIERFKGVTDLLEGPSLFAEQVDDQGHDMFARGEDRTILIPSGLLVDGLGNPEITAENGDQGDRSHGMGKKRLDRGSHRNLRQS